MARILANPFGEIRGKVAGNVFSRNGSGQIMRAYVIPANRNTIAQQRSRSKFRDAAQSWKTLTQVQQQNWNDFSVSEYNPLRKVNSGQFSGFMAQVGVRAGVLNAMATKFTATYTALAAGTDPTGTGDIFVPSSTPPIKSIQANLKQSAGPPATFAIGAGAVTAAGVVSFDVTILAPDGTNDADNFIDENSNAFTWRVFMSDPISQVGGRPKNDFFNTLGNCELITFATNTLSGLTGVNISWDFSSLIPDMLSFPQVGQIVKLTYVVISVDGTMSNVMNEYVKLT